MKAAVLRRLRKEEKGFTLIELLAVIVILGIIAAIAVPLIGNVIDKSKKDADVATARQVYDAARLYVTAEKNGTPPTSVTVGQLQTGGYLDDNLTLPSTKKTLNTSASVVNFTTSGDLASVDLVDTSTSVVTKSYDASEVISSEDKDSTTSGS